MNDPARVTVLPLGQLSIVSAMHQMFEGIKGKGKISEASFFYYQSLQRHGFITISGYRDLTKGFQGWGAWEALTQEGIQKQFHAEATPQAQALLCPEKVLKQQAIVKGLCLKEGHVESISVTQNQLLTSGSDYYRVIRGSHDWVWDSQFLQVMQRPQDAFKRERKFALLLKFDPYQKSWSSVTMDVGNRDAELSSKTVEEKTAGMTPVQGGLTGNSEVGGSAFPTTLFALAAVGAATVAIVFYRRGALKMQKSSDPRMRTGTASTEWDSAVAGESFCGDCGAALRGSARFCAKCGSAR